LRPRSGPAQIKEPRLISSETPTYPAAARQTHTEGDIVVDIAIDQTGKVADAQVVSGPQILRQAALDALRHWRYEPSTLDGQPVPSKLSVRIKFRL
jgi:TonB family protein